MLTNWGYSVWDGVDPDTRHSFPKNIEQLRVVQYESCRGLEGWTVVNLSFDEFYNVKRNRNYMSESDMELSKYSDGGTLDWQATDDEILQKFHKILENFDKKPKTRNNDQNAMKLYTYIEFGTLINIL